MKQLRDAHHIPNESAEGTSKTFDLSLKTLHLENTRSIDVFVKTLFQTLYAVCPFDKFDDEDEAAKNHITFKKGERFRDR